MRPLYDNVGINAPGDDSGCDIDVEDFLGGFALFAWDMTPDKCNGFHFHENRDGTIDLEVLFNQPLKHAITVICYTAYENVVAITSERHIIPQL